DPAEVKARQGRAVAYLETVWQGLRRSELVFLTNREAHALAGDLYRAWADGDRESDLAATYDPETGRWSIESLHELPPREAEAGFLAAVRRLTIAAERGDLEA